MNKSTLSESVTVKLERLGNISKNLGSQLKEGSVRFSEQNKLYVQAISGLYKTEEILDVEEKRMQGITTYYSMNMMVLEKLLDYCL